MFLGTDSVLALVSNIQYLTRGLSDHSTIVATLDKIKPKTRTNWRVPSFWFKIQHQADSTNQALTEFFHINDNSASPQVVWDTMKAFLRGLLLKTISVYKKN